MSKSPINNKTFLPPEIKSKKLKNSIPEKKIEKFNNFTEYLTKQEYLESSFLNQFILLAKKEEIHLYSSDFFALRVFSRYACPEHSNELLKDIFENLENTFEKLALITHIPLKKLFHDFYKAIINHDRQRQSQNKRVSFVPSNMTIIELEIFLNLHANQNMKLKRQILLTYYLSRLDLAYLN